MKNWHAVLFAVVAVVLLTAVVVGLLFLWGPFGGNFDDPQRRGQGFELIILAVLALITLFYAWSTRQIAHQAGEEVLAATKLTEATIDTLKEMEAQRIESNKPKITLKSTKVSRAQYFLKTVKVQLKNVGSGPSINTRCSFQHPDLSYAPECSDRGTMEIGRETFCEFEVTEAPTYEEGMSREGTVVARYQDVDGRTYESNLLIIFDPTTDQDREVTIAVARLVAGVREASAS